MKRGRIPGVIGLLAVFAGLAVPAAALSNRAAAVVVRAGFEASMPDRFGGDADGDGLIDLPNSPAYVRPNVESGCGPGCPSRFTLVLDATGSRATMGESPLEISSYRWEISGPGARHLVRRESGPYLELQLAEGRYYVSLEVQAALPWGGGARARSGREVAVEDVLVVALGDSYASGEGNPEKPRRGEAGAIWADAPGDLATAASHAAAHRSTVAWPALAALELERSDPATSVTFVSVAATSARVGAGLLEAQPGVAAQGQVDQAAALVGGRRIDLLLISIGGNDVGFAHIVRGLVDADRLADPICYGTDLHNIWEAAGDGDWHRGSELGFGLPWGVTCRQTRSSGGPTLPGLDGLGAELDRLAEAMKEQLDVAGVYLMEYPDPTGGGEDEVGCGEIVGDVTPPFGFHEINRAEQAEGRERVVAPLNRILAEAAARHGWALVGGPAADFAAGHGYCAPRPSYPAAPADAANPGSAGGGAAATAGWYRHPATWEQPGAFNLEGVSWYRTAAQSVALQGPDRAWDSAGTLHPNELGHLSIARSFLRLLEGD
ncbi:MAG: hypothetical protein JW785_09585 [Acidimicrobiia bacterium]|nr:hypothetical protein [Acidimicrobiia bacterium]